LRSAQHAWTGYRDAQLALLAARSSEGGGSIHRMQAADAALALSRDQAGRLLALQAPPAPDASAEDAPLFLEIDDFPRLDDFEDAAAFQARIDQYEEECRDAWISSSMGSKCGVAAGLWDRELNAAYRALLGVLDDEAKNELREGQRGWVRMRDATLAFDGRVQALHYDDGQRMWIPVMSVQRDGTLAELTKTRTLQLRTWKRRIDSPVSSLL
ncbi:MAG: lysozyme inhibitor LprI family protein, partial [Myxococcota bacterium]